MATTEKIPLFVVLALACLASGAALLITIFLNTPLSLSLALMVFMSATLYGSIYVRMEGTERQLVRQRIKIGLIAGLFGTAAYDLSRWLIFIAGVKFWPFGAFPIFGKLLIGANHSLSTLYAAGFCYHLLNGTLFAVAYCMLFSGRAWWYGVIWALVLEAFMFSIYPGWLNLKAVMMEFTVISVSGHVAYGTMLGQLAARLPAARGLRLAPSIKGTEP